MSESFSGSFRDLLIHEYSERKKKNGKYSLRAFANKIGMDQSLLSKVMKGKRDISLLTMKSCLENLDLSSSDIEMLLIRFSKRNFYHRPVEEDIFNVISHWSHFAILELFKLKDLIQETHEIAVRLNLDLATVEDSLERLERFGFIVYENETFVLKRPNNTWTSHTVTTEARRNLQKSLLEKSIQALEEIPIERRHHSSYTFAISTNKLQELKERILELTLELGNIADQDENFEEVYQFTISLFPLTTAAVS